MVKFKMEMMKVKSRSAIRPLLCRFLVFLHLLLGAGAVFGGAVLIIDLSGALINMPVDILQSSPFHDFLFPGIILFGILEIAPLLTAIGLFTERPWNLGRKIHIFNSPHWAWNFSLYTGFALIIWITVQVFIIGSAAMIHLFYMGLGLTIQAAAVSPPVQERYKLSVEKTKRLHLNHIAS